MNHNLFRSSDATVSGVSTSDPLRRNTEVSEVPTVSTVVTSGSMEKSDPTITDVNPIVQVDPFNSTGESGVQYQTMEWWNVSLLMLAETISLGILSLPWAIAKLGLLPGLLLISLLGILATYNGYVIGQFKLVHPHIHTMAAAGEILFGWIGREVFGTAQVMVLIFIMAAHITTFTVMMNSLTNHGACSIIWSAMGLAISFVLSLPRTMHKMSYLSILSSVSVLAAVVVVMVNVAKDNPHGAASLDAVSKHIPFTTAFTGVLNIILAYSGHVAYIGFASELRDPRDFKWALFVQQGIAITLYSIVGGVIYYYGGPNVSSPAISAAKPHIAKIAYGVASLTIVVAGVVNAHVACKCIYLRVCPKIIQQRSFKSLGTWIAIVAACWIIAWVLAESIPSFPYMLGIVSALFSGWFSYGVSGMFWLHMNRGKLLSSKGKMFLTCLNSVILVMGLLICVLGLYSTGTEVAHGLAGKPFSCADNRPKLEAL